VARGKITLKAQEKEEGQGKQKNVRGGVAGGGPIKGGSQRGNRNNPVKKSLKMSLRLKKRGGN